MKAATWLRLLAAIMTFFTIGHTIGVLNPPAEGVAGQALDAMRRARFPIWRRCPATGSNSLRVNLFDPFH